MAFWSRKKPPAPAPSAPAATGDPLADVRWIGAKDNPFGVEILDCRPLALSVITSTKDPKVGDTYAPYRMRPAQTL